MPASFRAGNSIAGAPVGLSQKVVCSCGHPLTFPLGAFGQTMEACTNAACEFATPHKPTGLGQRTSGHEHPRPYRKKCPPKG